MSLNTRLFAALCLLFALAGAMGPSGCSFGCTPKTNEVATFYADNAYKVLETAYALDSVRADRSCLAYECLNVDECAAVDECPDHKAVTAHWTPVWDAYEAMAALIEEGRTEEARAAYCALVNVTQTHAATAKIPLPPCR